MSEFAYLAQAKHNREVADVLLRDDPPISRQWAITCMFYAALHYVNAYICRRGQQVPREHGNRDRLVGKWMRQIFREYRWLRTRSEHVRYSMVNPDEQQVRKSCQKLATIETFVLKHGQRTH